MRSLSGFTAVNGVLSKGGGADKGWEPAIPVGCDRRARHRLKDRQGRGPGSDDNDESGLSPAGSRHPLG
ncbi:hypothetical protein HMPREF1549_01312 [Actinomyces johnsonii F0510]|uniref:Uncharacterized protein n=1 Tax=Actinomyces johnsonii F0510 TaxID=1227262 RepID=U1RKL4_9ACTO|nr:hypothetical protein HMPREF1549_01312 [Actinomyces johnsonii F0510]